jgi:membrane protein involved in colicin uptake
VPTCPIQSQGPATDAGSAPDDPRIGQLQQQLQHLQRQLNASRQQRRDETTYAAKARSQHERWLTGQLRFLKAQLAAMKQQLDDQKKQEEARRQKEVEQLQAANKQLHSETKALKQQVAQLRTENKQQAAAAEADLANMGRALNCEAAHRAELQQVVVRCEDAMRLAVGDIVRGKAAAAGGAAAAAAAANAAAAAANAAAAAAVQQGAQAFAALVQQVNVIAARSKDGVAVGFTPEIDPSDSAWLVKGTGANGAVVKGMVKLELPPEDTADNGGTRYKYRPAVAKRFDMGKLHELPLCLASGWRKGVACYGLLAVDVWGGGPEWAIVMADGGQSLAEIIMVSRD